MIKGLFFDEDGTVQQLGAVVSWGAIIQSIEDSLPKLYALYKNNLPAQQLSEEDLEKLLLEKRKNKENNKEVEQ